MRIAFVILLFLAIGLASSQQTERRARLRNLISRAREGDAEARSTLKELRQRLKLRRNQVALKQAPEPTPPTPSVTTFHPTTTPTEPTTTPKTTTIANDPPRSSNVVEKTDNANVFPLFETRRDEPRQRTRERVTFEPHRAINRGLEVTSRSEQSPLPADSVRASKKKAAPIIETTRRYAYFDDFGNYIFGYEAADGSFKEEIRGKDCVVKGKYGYIDPDGVRREYTYISGNRCDPNPPPNAELVEAPPLNDQFLHQTQERRLTDSEMKVFKQQRRRRPVKSSRVPQRQSVRAEQAPVVQTFEPTPVSTPQQPQIRPKQRTSSIFPPFPGVKKVKPKVHEFPPFPAAEPKTDSKLPEPKPKIAPKPKKTLPSRPPTPPAAFPPQPAAAPAVFTTNPNVIQFDFDREFSSLFSNFPETRRFQQPTPQPSPFRPAAAPKKPTPVEDNFKLRDFSQLRSADPNEPHQLVYDAASRTFKTVPLDSLITLATNKANGPPSLTQFKPKASPLPQIPLGGLSFGSTRNKMSAKEFDDFFKNVELIVKTKPL